MFLDYPLLNNYTIYNIVIRPSHGYIDAQFLESDRPVDDF